MWIFKLHLMHNDMVVRVNFTNVCAYWKRDTFTVVQFSGDADNYIEVRETPEEIDEVIKLLYYNRKRN